MEMVECQEAPSHGKNIYGNLPAARHAPSKKVRSTSYYRFLRSAFLWVKQNYGKIRPDATQIFTDPCRTFFHFQNSVGDHTHAHKRTFEYIQLLFGLHSLRHAMIILLSHLISINYSNCFQPDNHHQTIKPPNHIIKSSTHHHHRHHHHHPHHHHHHPAHRCYHYPDSTFSLSMVLLCICISRGI